MAITNDMNKNHEFIKYQLRVKGTSLAQISRELGVAKTNVTAVLKGRATSARIQKAIADALGETVEQVFPDRYSKAKSLAA